MPIRTSEEKYKVLSLRRYGYFSSPIVFIEGPKLTGALKGSIFLFRFATHISKPPCPPGMSDEKYSDNPVSSIKEVSVIKEEPVLSYLEDESLSDDINKLDVDSSISLVE